MAAITLTSNVTPMSEMRYVLAASYDDVDDALAAYQEINVAYKHVGTTLDFDAAVVAKDESGDVKIVERHDVQARHDTTVGLGWGLAAGAVAAIFPAVGIVAALAVGGGTGAAIGALVGRTAGGMSRDDLKQLGEVLDRGNAGLVVVYGPDMADRVSGALGKAAAKVRTTTDLSNEQLAERIRAAEASSR